MQETWKTLGIKDKIQYISAMALIASGIILAFVCAIFNFWEITTGVLIYVAQAFVAGGSIYGVSIYFKSNLGEFRSDVKKIMDELVKKANETDT